MNPNFLVQVGTVLHAYWRLDILLADLASNGADGVSVFERDNGLTLRYVPVAVDALRARAGGK